MGYYRSACLSKQQQQQQQQQQNPDWCAQHMHVAGLMREQAACHDRYVPPSSNVSMFKHRQQSKCIASNAMQQSGETKVAGKPIAQMYA